jgi:hypothetical protein
MDTPRHKRIRRILWAWWLVLVVFLVVLWSAAPARADDDPQGSSSSVIYQVTYQDRSIRNLTEPPKTDKGILMVVRITRTNSALPSSETVSTGNQSVEMLNPGRTQMTQLEWDGKAWTSAVKIKDPPPDSPTPIRKRSAAEPAPAADPTATPPPRERPISPREVSEKLQKVMELLGVADRAIQQAESQIAILRQDSPAAATSTQQAITEARKAQQEIVSTVIDLKDQLAKIRPDPVAEKDAAAAAPTESTAEPGEPAYDPNRVVPPPAVLRTNVDATGCWENSGWSGCPGWPYFGSASIYTEEPNPDYDVGPRVIIREQK